MRLAVSGFATGLVMAAGLVAAARPQAPAGDPKPLLAAASRYLDQYAKAFAAVTSEEVYDLSVIRPRPSRSTEEELRSDLVLIVSGEEWIQVRDVYEVDHKPVRDHVQRLQAILAKPASGPSDLKAIVAESARFNIGHIERNFNTPTLALSYLDRTGQGRSTFTVVGQESVAGVDTAILSFEETARPSWIQTNGRSTQTSGRFWVDPQTGAVLKTRLDVIAGPITTTARITVSYDHPHGIDLWAPVHMTESYVNPDETDVGDATYADFKQFVVDTKTLLGRGGGR